jgi:hypothetical protein
METKWNTISITIRPETATSEGKFVNFSSPKIKKLFLGERTIEKRE